MIRACKKSRYVTAQNFEIETIFFRRFYFRFARFYAVFQFRCVARATFDRNLNHSADAFLSYGVCSLLAREAKNPFEPP